MILSADLSLTRFSLISPLPFYKNLLVYLPDLANGLMIDARDHHLIVMIRTTKNLWILNAADFQCNLFTCPHSGSFLVSLVSHLPFYLLSSSLLSHSHTSLSVHICLLFWRDRFWLILKKKILIARTFKIGRLLWEAEHFLYHHHVHYYFCLHCLPFLQLTCQNLVQL